MVLQLPLKPATELVAHQVLLVLKLLLQDPTLAQAAKLHQHLQPALVDLLMLLLHHLPLSPLMETGSPLQLRLHQAVLMLRQLVKLAADSQVHHLQEALTLVLHRHRQVAHILDQVDSLTL